MSRVPRIRFKGFEEDWEQRKLGEVADIIGGGTPSTLNSDYWDGNIDWYSPAEIIDQIYMYKSQRKITELGLEKSSAKMLPIGTVLFTSRAGIGKTAILAKRGCTNQGFQSIVPYSNTLDSYFIFSRTEELKKYGELVGAGSTFVEVSGRQMENMQLMIPKTIGEQHIIGLLFSTLDHLITLHQRKLEKLKIIKKSMLENLFPQSEEKTPKIRFSGFTKDWEQRKLKDFGKATGGISIESEFDEYGKYKVISIGSYSEESKYTDQGIRVYKTKKTESRILNKNDLVMILNDKTSSGNIIGRVLLVDKDNTYVYNQRTERIEINKSKFLPEYLYQLLNSDNIRIKIICASQGNTQIYVNWTVIREFTYIITTDIEEQGKIARFFITLDHLITLHQSKLEKLQKIKKSMLESMFV